MKKRKISEKKIRKLNKKKSRLLPQTPKTYLTINNKHYRAIDPLKALTIAKRLSSGKGAYKVRVIYGKTQISKRKKEIIENEGKYRSAREAKNAIQAFLNKDLWIYA